MAPSPLFATYISRAIYYTNFRKALADEKKISGIKSCDTVTGVANRFTKLGHGRHVNSIKFGL